MLPKVASNPGSQKPAFIIQHLIKSIFKSSGWSQVVSHHDKNISERHLCDKKTFFWRNRIISPLPCLLEPLNFSKSFQHNSILFNLGSSNLVQNTGTTRGRGQLSPSTRRISPCLTLPTSFPGYQHCHRELPGMLNLDN